MSGKEKKQNKKVGKVYLNEREKRNIVIITTIVVLAIIGIAFAIGARPKTIKTDTGKFYIVEEGDYSKKITLSIDGAVPSKYRLRIDIPADNDVYTFKKVSEKDNKVVFEIGPKNRGASILDFYYETPDGNELYTKLHYTVDVSPNGKVRLYEVNVTDPSK